MIAFYAIIVMFSHGLIVFVLMLRFINVKMTEKVILR